MSVFERPLKAAAFPHTFCPAFMRCIVTAALLILSVATSAQGQADLPYPTRPEPTTVIGLNPIALAIGAVIGDFEKTIRPALTIGVGASVLPSYLNRYRAAEAKLRYYPDEHALHGVSLGLTAGLVSQRYRDYNRSFDGVRRNAVNPTIGTELSYQWILGPSSRFAMVVGAGAKRILGSNSDRSYGTFAGSTVATFRLNLGVAF